MSSRLLPISLFLISLAFTNQAHSVDGILNQLFSDDGFLEVSWVTTSFNGSGSANSITSVGGQLVIAGVARTVCDDGQITYCAVAIKYKDNGDVDTTFSDDGRILLNPQSTGNLGVKITSDIDDNIFLAYSSTGYMYVNKYTVDGSLDPTYGNSGTATFQVATPYLRDVLIDSNGKLVIIGEGNISGVPNDYDIVAIRFNSNGSPDNTFGQSGIYSYPSSGIDSGQSVAEQVDKKLVISGYVNEGASGRLIVLRLSNNGSLDTSFGISGVVEVQFDGFSSKSHSVLVQNDGKIVASGIDFKSTGTRNDFAVVRLNSDGNLDTSFSDDGKLTINYETDNLEYVIDSYQQEDGKILFVGTTAGGGNSVALSRVNNNGTLDTTFNSTGKQRYFTTGSTSYGAEFIELDNGDLVIAGGYLSSFLLMRVHNQTTDINGISLNVDTVNDLNKGAIFSNNGELIINTDISLTNDMVLVSGDLNINASSSVALEGGIYGAGSIRKTGIGNVTLNGENKHTGGLLLEQGVVSITNDKSVGIGQVNISGGVLQFSNTVSINNNIVVNTAGGILRVSVDHNTILGDITGLGELSMEGNGSTDFKGSISNSNGINIKSGKVSINGEAQNSVTVSGGKLGGSGVVDNVQVSQGTVSPGNSIGTLTINNDLLLSSNSIYEVEISSNGKSDKVDVAGNITLSGTLVIVPEIGTYSDNTRYVIAASAKGITGSFSDVIINDANMSNITNMEVEYSNTTIGLVISSNSSGTAADGGGGSLSKIEVAFLLCLIICVNILRQVKFNFTRESNYPNFR